MKYLKQGTHYCNINEDTEIFLAHVDLNDDETRELLNIEKKDKLKTITFGINFDSICAAIFIIDLERVRPNQTGKVNKEKLLKNIDSWFYNNVVLEIAKFLSDDESGVAVFSSTWGEELNEKELVKKVTWGELLEWGIYVDLFKEVYKEYENVFEDNDTGETGSERKTENL